MQSFTVYNQYIRWLRHTYHSSLTILCLSNRCGVWQHCYFLHRGVVVGQDIVLRVAEVVKLLA